MATDAVRQSQPNTPALSRAEPAGDEHGRGGACRRTPNVVIERNASREA